MSGWNYRILKQEDGMYGVHEVFYGRDEWVGEPEGEKDQLDKITWTEPVPEGLVAETLPELLSMIKMVYEDTLKYPVIDEKLTLENECRIVEYADSIREVEQSSED